MTLLWLWSLVRRDVSVVDPFWSIGFLLVPALADAAHRADAGKLLLACVALWSLRLRLHLSPARARQAGRSALPGLPPPLRRRALLVGQLLPGLPPAGRAHADRPAPLRRRPARAAPLAGTTSPASPLWLVGFAFEAVADRSSPASATIPASGPRARPGLWRYSRHPNYFGETLLGWGLFLCALDEPGGWLTVFAPAAHDLPAPARLGRDHARDRSCAAPARATPVCPPDLGVRPLAAARSPVTRRSVRTVCCAALAPNIGYHA